LAHLIKMLEHVEQCDTTSRDGRPVVLEQVRSFVGSSGNRLGKTVSLASE